MPDNHEPISEVQRRHKSSVPGLLASVPQVSTIIAEYASAGVFKLGANITSTRKCL